MRVKGYEPPRPGIVCYLANSHGPWSSGTRVEIIDPELPDEMALVQHLSTKGEQFEVPIDKLVKKRKR
jgi:hypothetical protein